MRYFEVCSFSLRSFYISYLKSFCPDFSLSHSFISSIIYVSSTHGYLCHTLSYNAKQLYLFCFGFGHWERFRVGPVSFDTSSSLFSFVGFDFFFFCLNTCLHFCYLAQDGPSSSCIYAAFSL